MVPPAIKCFLFPHCVIRERSDSEVSSSESVKSDQSKGDVPLFNEETPTKRYFMYFLLSDTYRPC